MAYWEDEMDDWTPEDWQEYLDASPRRNHEGLEYQTPREGELRRRGFLWPTTTRVRYYGE
jgi:hypothetical protein